MPDATGGIGAKTYSVDNLPADASFDPATLTLSGRFSGRTTITYRVRDSASGRPNTITHNIELVPGSPLQYNPSWTSRTISIGGSFYINFPSVLGGYGRITYRADESGVYRFGSYTLTTSYFSGSNASVTGDGFVSVTATDESGRSATYRAEFTVTAS